MILEALPTTTIYLIVGCCLLFVLLIAGLGITLFITKHEKFNKTITNKYVFYLKEINKYKCPKCGSDFQIYRTKDYKTLYKCTGEDCGYKVDPEELINGNKKAS